MPQTIIFRDLPATFPTEDCYRRHAALGSVLAHTLMLGTALVLPILFTATLPDLRVLTYVVPPPPASGTVMVAAQPQAPAAAPKKAPVLQRQSEATLFTPVAIPEEIARVLDVPDFPVEAATFGVPGGIPGGGMRPELLRSIQASPLLSDPTATLAPPMPPPPEAVVPERHQESPIRLSEFAPLRTVQTRTPAYPRAAKLARLQGTVLLELTLNEEGRVDEVRIVSGHPLLTQAAVDCVRNWVYEPPVINGKAVRVILPVRLNFRFEI